MDSMSKDLRKIWPPNMHPEPEPVALEEEQPMIPYFSSLEVQAVYYE